jgi:hypothetical protein
LLRRHFNAVYGARIAALGFWARGDVAASAPRACVRLKAVRMILEKRFTEPDFSTQNLSVAGGRCSATSPSIQLQRSVLYFDRCFRTRFGLTPTAARGDRRGRS